MPYNVHIRVFTSLDNPSWRSEIRRLTEGLVAGFTEVLPDNLNFRFVGAAKYPFAFVVKVEYKVNVKRTGKAPKPKRLIETLNLAFQQLGYGDYAIVVNPELVFESN